MSSYDKLINEASLVKDEDLKSSDQDKIKDIEKVLKLFKPKTIEVWDGIHGMIVTFDVQTIGTPRLSNKEMKGLLKLGSRWIQLEGDTVTVAF